MQTESDDFDTIEAEVREATEADMEYVANEEMQNRFEAYLKEHNCELVYRDKETGEEVWSRGCEDLASELKAGIALGVNTAEPIANIVLDPLAINLEVPIGTLDIGVDHFLSGFRVLDEDLEVVADVKAVDCYKEPNGYHVCTIELPLALYFIDFVYVKGYETPEEVSVDLTADGTEVYGYYAEEENTE